jgi:hypothetical protein
MDRTSRSGMRVTALVPGFWMGKMIDLFSSRALVIALTFFVAGIVKGVTGMGLPTVAMGVLGAIMPPVAAASLLVIPSFVTNFWQLITGPNFTALMSRLWLMMLGILLGTVAGSRLLTSANTEWTTIGLVPRWHSIPDIAFWGRHCWSRRIWSAGYCLSSA